jgi:uncharacterized membrane protein YedE/YeeE
MTRTSKVLDFLDVSGHWDPSLLLVLGGALVVTAISFRFILRRSRPLLEERFHLPQRSDVDLRLVTGASLFGVRWGISGYCPGPAIAQLATPSWETAVFVPALFLGALLHRLTRSARSALPSGTQADAGEGCG